MKLVKETISFQRYRDPKEALGLDPLAPQSFSSEEEHAKYLVDILPIIFKGEIPKNILFNPAHVMIQTEYYLRIQHFLNNKLNNLIYNPKTGERYYAHFVPEKSLIALLKAQGFKVT